MVQFCLEIYNEININYDDSVLLYYSSIIVQNINKNFLVEVRSQ